MTRLRGALLAALLWCGVVAVVSTLVWVVISRAGAGVVPLTQPQADVTGSLPVPASETRPAAPVSPGVTVRPRPSHSTAPAAPSTATTTTTPAAPPPSSPSTPSSSSSRPPSGPAPQRRSWNGNEGHVVAECEGRSIRLVTGFPNPGWRYAVLSRGPTLVEVRYDAIGTESWSVTIQARCLAGAPHFSEPHTDDGGDD